MNRALSIPEWHRLAMEGTALPVRIPLMGISMFPLIRYNRDYVTVVPAEKDLQVGDIVLFVDQERELYVMHRVWELNGDMVLTWGDNCIAPDRWMAREEIWGRAVMIERGKRKINADPRKGIRWAKFWHRAGKVYRYCENKKCDVVRRLRKLSKRGNK